MQAGRKPGCRRAIAAGVVAVGLGVLGGAWPAQACDVRFMWEDWPPFTYWDPAEDRLHGVDVALAQLYAEHAGCTAHFVEVPWARQLLQVERGERTLMMSASRTDAREAFARFSLTYRTESTRLFMRAGEAAGYPATAIEDLIGHVESMGLVRGHYLGEAVDAALDDDDMAHKFVYASDTSQLFRMLTLGRIDGALSDRFVGFAEMARTETLGAVQLHPVPVSRTDIHFMVARGDWGEAVLDKLNAAIDALDGTAVRAAVLAPYLF